MSYFQKSHHEQLALPIRDAFIKLFFMRFMAIEIKMF